MSCILGSEYIGVCYASRFGVGHCGENAVDEERVGGRRDVDDVESVDDGAVCASGVGECRAGCCRRVSIIAAPIVVISRRHGGEAIRVSRVEHVLVSVDKNKSIAHFGLSVSRCCA